MSANDCVELRQLDHFLAVVEEGSFTAAATRLYLGQSTLSASLLALERELGTELFVRGRRGVELSDAGQRLVGPARAALAEIQRARDSVGQVKDLLYGTVRIAALHPGVPRSTRLGDAILRFGRQHPGVRFQLRTADARETVDLVADGRVDFAITPSTERLSPKLRFQPLLTAHLGLVCHAGHHLAGQREVATGDLAGETIIDLPATWQSRALFDRLLHDRGVHRQSTVEVDHWLGALSLAQQGVGLAYGPLECLDPELLTGLVVVALSEGPTWEVGIATRDEDLRGAAGRAFLVSYLERFDGRSVAATTAEHVAADETAPSS